MSQSIADNFIEVMSNLRALEPDSDDPMRYVVRLLRSEAEVIINDALRHAQQLAYSAHQVQRDHKDAVKDAVDAAKPSLESQA